jgi:hypothetical protein
MTETPIDDLAEMMTLAAEQSIERDKLTAWVADNREAFGELSAMRGLSALWAAALAEAGSEDFAEKGPPYFLRDHDLAEWAASLNQEDVPYSSEQKVQRFRWHQFGEDDLIGRARVRLTAGEIEARLGISSIRGQWDQWVFEDFLFFLEDGTRCVLTRKMENRVNDHETFVLEIETDDREAVHVCLGLLGLSESDVDWLEG